VPPEVFPRRQVIVQRQFDRLRDLLRAIGRDNKFYSAKYEAAGAPSKVSRLHDFYEGFPCTTKEELVLDQAANPPYGTNLTYPLERYTRCHQTSGTSGTPLRWLDTPESWDAMIEQWATVMRVSGVAPADNLFFAFSFGPFLGFWLAFEAGLRLGCRCLPGGGMSSAARARAVIDLGATVLCCTPTYAIHLAEVAVKEKIDLGLSQVKTILVAGEPGGSIPAVREHIASLWPGSRVADHHGMTEVGPVSFECPDRPGVLHVMESAFLPEVIDPATGAHVRSGDPGELVLTTLNRTGSPLLRYRTGDLVKTSHDEICPCGRSDLALEGGILGRVDDMVVVRGVNVFPGAVDEIIRAQAGVAEYQVRVSRAHALAQLSVKVEPRSDWEDADALARQLEGAFESAMNLRVPVTAVPPGTLPRFEMKAQRWVRE
jgi:phenylacetate-CoA ligase